MSQVLARVATGVHEIPRGPDVLHRIVVKRSWLERGDVIEFELPRNLACAACAGGGCDRCGRAGAISLRGRRDAAVVLTVPLPQRSAEEITRDPEIVLRVPDQGGVAEPESQLPRGLLLLRIAAATKSGAGVRRVKGAAGIPSLAPDRPPEEAPPSSAEILLPVPPAGADRSRIRLSLIGVAFVALLALLYFALRAH